LITLPVQAISLQDRLRTSLYLGGFSKAADKDHKRQLVATISQNGVVRSFQADWRSSRLVMREALISTNPTFVASFILRLYFTVFAHYHLRLPPQKQRAFHPPWRENYFHKTPH
jgi:hypothetical protein